MRTGLACVAVWACVCLHPTAAPQDADGRAILNHRLTMDLVKRTVAVDRAFLELVGKDPELLKRLDGQTTKGIDGSAKAMEAVPEIAGVLKANGISARDYVLTQMAMLSTSLMHEFIAKGQMPGPPPDMPTHNLEFWKAHAEELKPLDAEWKKTRADLQSRARQ